MKALILDGSRDEEVFSRGVRQALVRRLTAVGFEVEAVALRAMEIRHCVGCFGCWVQTPGECMIDDCARGITRAYIASDVVVFFTPVTFGGYSSELKKVLDRIICLVSPFFDRINGEVHHKPRYRRYPRLMGVGVQPRPDRESEEIFTSLVARNAINMHVPAHAAAVIDSHQPGEIVEETLRSLIDDLRVGT